MLEKKEKIMSGIKQSILDNVRETLFIDFIKESHGIKTTEEETKALALDAHVFFSIDVENAFHSRLHKEMRSKLDELEAYDLNKSWDSEENKKTVEIAKELYLRLFLEAVAEIGGAMEKSIKKEKDKKIDNAH